MDVGPVAVVLAVCCVELKWEVVMMFKVVAVGIVLNVVLVDM